MNDIYYNDVTSTLFLRGITPQGAPFVLSRKDNAECMRLEYCAIKRDAHEIGSVGMVLRTANCGYIWYCLTRGNDVPAWYYAHNPDTRTHNDN